MDPFVKSVEPKRIAPTLLTKRELSLELRKSCRTIENWVRAGYISCIKVGHSVFFDRDQVFEDLRKFQVGSKRVPLGKIDPAGSRRPS